MGTNCAPLVADLFLLIHSPYKRIASIHAVYIYASFEMFMSFALDLLIFLKISFAVKCFQEYHQSVKQLGTDQHQHFVGLILSSNCLHNDYYGPSR